MSKPNVPLSLLNATYQSKMVLNVKDYGAKGDGSTDDTAAIQSALTAAGTNGSIVYFPVGTFRITSTLTISSQCQLIGASNPGTCIQAVSDITMLTNTGGSSITIQNMLISNTTQNARTNWDVTLINNYHPRFNNVEIRCAGNATGTAGVFLQKIVGQANDTNTFMPQFQECWFHNCRLYVDGVTDGKISGCWIWANATAAPGAIEFEGSTGNPSNWNIVDTDIVPSATSGINIGVGLTNIRVENVFFDGSYSNVYTGTAIVNTAGYTRGLKVIGCTFYNLSEGGLNLNDVRGCSIVGNHFMQNNRTDNFFPEIKFTAGVGNTISGNTFSADIARTNKGLIYTEDATSSDNTVSGNAFEVPTGGYYYNTSIYSAQSSTVVSNNRPTANWPINTVVARTGSYTILKDDLFYQRTISANGTFSVTMPSAGSVHAGDRVTVKNNGTGIITIMTTSSQTIDGSPNLTLQSAQAVTLQGDGSNWFTVTNALVAGSSSGTYTSGNDARLLLAALQPKSGQWQGATNAASLSATQLSGTSGQASFDYFDIDQTITIAALGIHCTIAGVGGTSPALQLGLFADDGSGSYPGALIVDAGSNALTTTGTVSGSALTQSLSPGRYWIGAKWTFTVVPTTLPTVEMISQASPGLPGSNLGNNYRGYITTGLAAGAWSGSAPTGMSASGGTTVMNAGYKAS